MAMSHVRDNPPTRSEMLDPKLFQTILDYLASTEIPRDDIRRFSDRWNTLTEREQPLCPICYVKLSRESPLLAVTVDRSEVMCPSCELKFEVA
jgi:hypothetical protein